MPCISDETMQYRPGVAGPQRFDKTAGHLVLAHRACTLDLNVGIGAVSSPTRYHRLRP
jgi:hypothetical protein